jgi:hypothetical protein
MMFAFFVKKQVSSSFFKSKGLKSTQWHCLLFFVRAFPQPNEFEAAHGMATLVAAAYRRQSGTAALVVLGLLAFITAAVRPMHWIAVVHVNWFARFSTANSKAQPLPSSPPVVFFNRIEASTRPPPQGSRKWQAMSLREQVLLMLHGPMTYPYPDF